LATIFIQTVSFNLNQNIEMTEWKSLLSLEQEFFDIEPSYPLATKIEHQSYEFHKQNMILKSLSDREREELKNTTTSICGSLENGFNMLFDVNTKGFNSIVSAVENAQEKLSQDLSQVNRNLEQINATLSWGFSSLIDQLTLSNKKLDQIIHLLNIPESQKERKHHLEEGFDNLKKSRYYPRRYVNAKKHFESAIKIKDDDYLSSQQLGIIHLYAEDLLDLELSEKYLNNSILDSITDIGFARNQQNPSSFHFTYNPAKITATSLMHLARNYFIKKDFEKAFETAKKGIEIYEMISIYYDLSKYACALNDKHKTLFFLDKALSMDRYISVKVLNDEVLIIQNYVQGYLNNLSKQTTNKALEDLDELKQTAHDNSLYVDEISKIESLVNKNTYLDSLKALERIGYELEN
jgi:tetratricopeptide (TPR) repeat protein